MNTVDIAYIDATPADVLDCIRGCLDLDNEDEAAAEFIRLYAEAQCHKVKAERDQLLALVGEWRETLEKISDDHECGGFDCYYCESNEQHPPTAYGVLAMDALAIAEHPPGETHEAALEALLALVGEWRQAFIDILNPITYLQKGLAPDEKLDGSMALELAKTLHMQIAEQALAIAEQREAYPPGYPPGKTPEAALEALRAQVRGQERKRISEYLQKEGTLYREETGMYFHAATVWNAISEKEAQNDNP